MKVLAISIVVTPYWCMIVPQFSLRQLLFIVALCGVFSVVLANATQGAPWAIAICVVLGWFLLLFTLFAIVFAVAWLFAIVMGSSTERPRLGSPLAADAPAPVVAPTEEIE